MDSLTSSLSQDISFNNNVNQKILQNKNKINLSVATVNPVIKSKRLFVNTNEIIDSTAATIKTSINRHHLKRKLVRLTCEGNLNDTNFPNKLRKIITKLKITLLNGKWIFQLNKWFLISLLFSIKFR